jgi:hypothetical protein
VAPTYGATAQFWRDHAVLTPSQKRAFRRAVDRFLQDVPTRQFRAGLRVRGVQGAEGIFEMTWAGDGRATFEYGPTVREGEPHVIWRRVGTHDIFGNP